MEARQPRAPRRTLGAAGLVSLAALAWACGSDSSSPPAAAIASSDAGGDSGGAVEGSSDGSTPSTQSDASSPDAPAGPAAFGVVKNQSTYVATSTADSKIKVEVDCDDDKLDGRYFGIAPVLDGKRFEIPMYGGPKFPIFTPDFDAGDIRCVRVESDATRLLVRLEAGSYKTLDPNVPDEPVPLEASFTVEAGHLVARLSGIYYTMLTAANTTLQITNTTTTPRTITSATAAFTEYYDDVTNIAVSDSIYGNLSIAGLILRLQVQLYNDGSQGFELDLDHSFKERGQKSVSTTVTFP